MSGDGQNGVSLSTIHELMMVHGRSLGQIEGHMGSIDRRLDSVENDMNSIRCSWQQQGIKLCEIGTSCLRHASDSAKRDEKISALFRAVNTVEDTGMIHTAAMEKEQAVAAAKWGTAKVIAAVAVALLSAANMVLVLWRGV
jgi:hypothetical protein